MKKKEGGCTSCKKAVAILTCISFIVVQVSSSFAAVHSRESKYENKRISNFNSNFWQERRSSIYELTQLPALGPKSLNSPLPYIQDLGPSSLLNIKESLPLRDGPAVLPRWIRTIPSSVAQLDDFYLPPGWKNGDLIVLHIRDAHQNKDAQKNIVRILESLPKSAQALVGLEGANGALNFNPYSSFPDKEITMEIADYFLSESLISGPEYLGMQGSSHAFFGIEDVELYTQNVEAFKSSIKKEKELNACVQKWELSLKNLETGLNSELKTLHKHVQQYQDGTLSLSRYIKYLTDSGIPRDLSALRSYRNALALEESLNRKKLEVERSKLLDLLASKLNQDKLRELASYSIFYRLGNISYGDFYRYLKESCIANGVHLSQWPEMDRYLRYVLLSDSFKGEELLQEVELLEQRKLSEVILSPKDRAIVELFQDLRLLKQLSEYKLGPGGWKKYKERSNKIVRIQERLEALGVLPNSNPEWESRSLNLLLEPFEKFNESAMLRNDALVKNLLKKMGDSSSPSHLGVLVAGGFHTEGMVRILKDKNIAYVTLTPRLGSMDKSGTEYLDIFRRDFTPLEKIFTGERINLKPASPFAPIGNVMAQIVPTIEGLFTAYAIGKFSKKFLSRIPQINQAAKKQVKQEMVRWFKMQKDINGMRTIRAIKIGAIQKIHHSQETGVQEIKLHLDLYGKGFQGKKVVKLSLDVKSHRVRENSDNRVKGMKAEIKGDILLLQLRGPNLLDLFEKEIEDSKEFGRKFRRIYRYAVAFGIFVGFIILNDVTGISSAQNFVVDDDRLVIAEKAEVVDVTPTIHYGIIAKTRLLFEIWNKVPSLRRWTVESKFSLLMGTIEEIISNGVMPTPEKVEVRLKTHPAVLMRKEQLKKTENDSNRKKGAPQNAASIKTLSPLLFLGTLTAPLSMGAAGNSTDLVGILLGGILVFGGVLLLAKIAKASGILKKLNVRRFVPLSPLTALIFGCTHNLFGSVSPQTPQSASHAISQNNSSWKNPQSQIKESVREPISSNLAVQTIDAKYVGQVDPKNGNQGVIPDYAFNIMPYLVWTPGSTESFNLPEGQYFIESPIPGINLEERPLIYFATNPKQYSYRFELELKNIGGERILGDSYDNVKKVLVNVPPGNGLTQIYVIDLGELLSKSNVKDKVAYQIVFSDPKESRSFSRFSFATKAPSKPVDIQKIPNLLLPVDLMPFKRIERKLNIGANLISDTVFSIGGPSNGYLEALTIPVDIVLRPILYLIFKTNSSYEFEMELRDRRGTALVGTHIRDNQDKLVMYVNDTRKMLSALPFDLRGAFKNRGNIMELFNVSDPLSAVRDSWVEFHRIALSSLPYPALPAPEYVNGSEPTPTPYASPTPNPTPTPFIIPTPRFTPSPSPTPFQTPSPSPSPTQTPHVCLTPTPQPTATPTPKPSLTPTPQPPTSPEKINLLPMIYPDDRDNNRSLYLEISPSGSMIVHPYYGWASFYIYPSSINLRNYPILTVVFRPIGTDIVQTKFEFYGNYGSSYIGKPEAYSVPNKLILKGKAKAGQIASASVDLREYFVESLIPLEGAYFRRGVISDSEKVEFLEFSLSKPSAGSGTGTNPPTPKPNSFDVKFQTSSDSSRKNLLGLSLAAAPWFLMGAAPLSGSANIVGMIAISLFLLVPAGAIIFLSLKKTKLNLKKITPAFPLLAALVGCTHNLFGMVPLARTIKPVTPVDIRLPATPIPSKSGEIFSPNRSPRYRKTMGQTEVISITLEIWDGVPDYAVDLLPSLTFLKHGFINIEKTINDTVLLKKSQGWAESAIPPVDLSKNKILYIRHKNPLPALFELELKNRSGQRILGGMVDNVAKVIVTIPASNDQYLSVIDLGEDLKLTDVQDKVAVSLVLSDASGDVEILQLALGPTEAPKPIDILPLQGLGSWGNSKVEIVNGKTIKLYPGFGFVGGGIVPVDISVYPIMRIRYKSYRSNEMEMEFHDSSGRRLVGIPRDNVNKLVLQLEYTGGEFKELTINLKDWNLVKDDPKAAKVFFSDLLKPSEPVEIESVTLGVEDSSPKPSPTPAVTPTPTPSPTPSPTQTPHVCFTPTPTPQPTATPTPTPKPTPTPTPIPTPTAKPTPTPTPKPTPTPTPTPRPTPTATPTPKPTSTPKAEVINILPYLRLWDNHFEGRGVEFLSDGSLRFHENRQWARFYYEKPNTEYAWLGGIDPVENPILTVKVRARKSGAFLMKYELQNRYQQTVIGKQQEGGFYKLYLSGQVRVGDIYTAQVNVKDYFIPGRTADVQLFYVVFSDTSEADILEFSFGKLQSANAAQRSLQHKKTSLKISGSAPVLQSVFLGLTLPILSYFLMGAAAQPSSGFIPQLIGHGLLLAVPLGILIYGIIKGIQSFPAKYLASFHKIDINSAWGRVSTLLFFFLMSGCGYNISMESRLKAVNTCLQAVYKAPNRTTLSKEELDVRDEIQSKFGIPIADAALKFAPEQLKDLKHLIRLGNEMGFINGILKLIATQNGVLEVESHVCPNKQILPFYLDSPASDRITKDKRGFADIFVHELSHMVQFFHPRKEEVNPEFSTLNERSIFDGDFVSSYAKTNEWEDYAETRGKLTIGNRGGILSMLKNRAANFTSDILLRKLFALMELSTVGNKFKTLVWSEKDGSVSLDDYGPAVTSMEQLKLAEYEVERTSEGRIYAINIEGKRYEFISELTDTLKRTVQFFSWGLALLMFSSFVSACGINSLNVEEEKKARAVSKVRCTVEGQNKVPDITVPAGFRLEKHRAVVPCDTVPSAKPIWPKNNPTAVAVSIIVGEEPTSSSQSVTPSPFITPSPETKRAYAPTPTPTLSPFIHPTPAPTQLAHPSPSPTPAPSVKSTPQIVATPVPTPSPSPRQTPEPIPTVAPSHGIMFSSLNMGGNSPKRGQKMGGGYKKEPEESAGLSDRLHLPGPGSYSQTFIPIELEAKLPESEAIQIGYSSSSDTSSQIGYSMLLLSLSSIFNFRKGKLSFSQAGKYTPSEFVRVAGYLTHEEIMAQNLGKFTVDMFDLSEISKDKLGALATRIRLAFAGEESVLISLITNKDTLDVEALREQLRKEYGITDEMMEKVSLGALVITRQDMIEQQDVDPSVQMDTNLIHRLLTEKIQKEFHLQLFTDNPHRFMQNWTLNQLRIFVIASATEVVEFIKGVEESGEAQTLYGRNQ